MKYDVIKLRSQRSKLDYVAGTSYRDRGSAVVKELISNGENVFLGIQSDDGMYTILGADAVFFYKKICYFKNS